MSNTPEYGPTGERVSVTVSKEHLDRIALFVEYVETRDDIDEATKRAVVAVMTDTDKLIDSAVEAFIDGVFGGYMDLDRPPAAL